jgi:sugar lactone lactonase YvrE
VLAMKLEKNLLGSATLLLSLASACASSPPPVEEAPPPGPPPAAEMPPAPVDSPPPAATAEAAKPAEPKPPAAAWRVTEGISTPESVLFDAAGDRFFVSNINGAPTDLDNNGYIAELSGDGKVVKPKLIEGGKDKIKLDAPKGLGLQNGVLWVSDVTVVRKFDVKSGAPKGEIAIKDATFLNDLAIAADGRVFVSDSGVKHSAAKGFEPTGTDAVYVIDKAGKVKPVAKSKDLSGPNGLLAVGKDIWVNTFGTNEIYRLDDKGAKQDVTKTPTGGLDGFAAMGDSLLVSSWEGKVIYKGKAGQKFEPALQGLEGAADFTYDTKRNRVVVPRFMGNAVEAYDLK